MGEAGLDEVRRGMDECVHPDALSQSPSSLTQELEIDL